MTLIGSSYFFKGIDGFVSKDRDFLEIVDNGNGFNYLREIHTKNRCTFTIVRRPKNELIDWALTHEPAMQVGKFLIPEVATEFGITIEDLKLLQPVIDRLDEKHEYEKVIYNAYLLNNNFTLTEEQLGAAYKLYCDARTATPTASETTATPTASSGT